MNDNNKKMTGKRFVISGMVIEIMSDEGESWKARNITTNASVLFKKSVIKNAIKLGKAEEVVDSGEQT